MEILVKRIAKELKTAKHCGVYEPDLSRFWACNGISREAQIAEFAEQNAWRLRFYKEGFCAIFDKAPRKRKPVTKLARNVNRNGSVVVVMA